MAINEAERMNLASCEEDMDKLRKKRIKIKNHKDISKNEYPRNSLREWKGCKYIDTP